MPNTSYRSWVSLTAGSLCLAIASSCAGAAESIAEPIPASRLEADDPNYIVARDSDGDDDGLRGKISLRYWFSSAPDRKLYFKFTNEFDWYPDTRDSGPVVGRTFNPGAIWRQPTAFDGAPQLKWIEGGYEHRSNGQATEVTGAGAAAAQQAYANGEHRYFDNISRGSDYFVFGVRAELSARTALNAKLKAYVDKDSAITWGPLANSATTISDYDRFTLRYLWNEKGLPSVDIEWTLGDRGLKTDSLNVGLGLGELCTIPIYARLHFGPLNTLSNYTERQTMVGIGANFRPWQ